MQAKLQRFRWLGRRLPSAGQRRVVVLTGARQTGKTTLVRAAYPSLRYVNLDAIEDRELLRGVRTAAWGDAVGDAILDEAQKEPSVFEKVKHAYDSGAIDFSVLLGSSRILLLDRIRETLAGRTFVYDLWPLVPSELRTPHDGTPDTPLVDRLLRGEEAPRDVLASEPEFLLGDADVERRMAIEHLASWGGMPELLRLDDQDRREWLRSYQTTWLERDLADLVRLTDLLPFRTLQRLAMLRTASLLSVSELARDAGVGANTARRYLEYLRISYQVFLLPPFFRNLTSSVVKAPKLYFVDLGLVRQATSAWGPLTGPLFETLVVSELHKWVHTSGLDAPLFFYRTRSGLEVDVLAQTPGGFVGIEIKNRNQVHTKDLTALRSVAGALGSEWQAGLVVYSGDRVVCCDEELAIWAVPVHRLL